MKLEISDAIMTWFLGAALIFCVSVAGVVALDRLYQRRHQLELMDLSVKQSIMVQESNTRRRK